MEPIRDLIRQITTAPPMPDAAFPRAARLVPGARELAGQAWQAMYLDALYRGATWGVLATLAIAVGMMMLRRGHNAIR
ncbi:hypothetical protein P12x_003072 [Tundrisphaera lichenicola]|uniref:hypothetical protein n=1 Tax=Tundrisphaera lichenicola TaxID=2029860 RepID=UPI003EB9BEC9